MNCIQHLTLHSPSAVELVGAMNVAWSERGDARLIDFSDVKTSELGGGAPITVNDSPNETDVPSVRKLRGQMPLLDASAYMRGKVSTSGVEVSSLLTQIDSLDRMEDVFFHADVVMHYC